MSENKKTEIKVTYIEKPVIEFATACSATPCFIVDEEKILINKHLKHWKMANLFLKIIKDDSTRINLYIYNDDVILHLGIGLEKFLRANIDDDRISSQGNSITKILLNLDRYKHWSLKNDDINLYNWLINEFKVKYESFSKHATPKNHKEYIHYIDIDKLNEYMNNIKKIWIWVLNKKFRNNIPEDQLLEFKETYE